MTGRGHRAFAAALALTASPWLVQAHGLPAAAAAVTATVAGATAPDWMEIRTGGRTLIPHRTVTHYPLAWAALLLVGAWWADHQPVPGALLLGFALGGLAHWLGDLGTPMGVPVWHPFRRTSLRLWRTGPSEWIPVAAAWGMAATSLMLGGTG